MLDSTNMLLYAWRSSSYVQRRLQLLASASTSSFHLRLGVYDSSSTEVYRSEAASGVGSYPHLLFALPWGLGLRSVDPGDMAWLFSC